MFAPRSRTPRTVAMVVGVLFLLAVGLWFGGHPSWLPSPLRSAFVSESATQKLQDQVFGLLTKDYYRKIDRTTLVNRGLAGAVASLDDPYSHYYDPSDYHAFQNTTTNPRDQGIGVAVQEEPRGVRIVEVYSGTPAARAGLTAGDIITRAGNTSLANRTVQFASGIIKGPPGTRVTLWVKHGSTMRKVRVARANVSVPVASGRMLHYRGHKLGYVPLTQFSQNSGAEVRSQVDKLRSHGAQALILDLRNNGGGLLQEAVNTASIFIPNGTIVSTDGRAQRREVYMAKGNAIPTSIPMAVLVNDNTASAAEIVTGALKDRHRATVVGTHTYGKGVFQEIQPLINGGALDFTVGEYFTPDGHNLGGGGVKRGVGIEPNVYARTDPKSKVDTALHVAEKTVAAKLR